MSGTDEFWEHHLTADGWVNGSWQTDGGGEETIPRPTNALLTVKHIEQGSVYKWEKWWTTIWESDDKAAIAKAIEKFGDKRNPKKA